MAGLSGYAVGVGRRRSDEDHDLGNDSTRLYGGARAGCAMSAGALAILVGGGPAPGINAVIAAATIEARNRGLVVLGCHDGYEWLMKKDTSHVEELEISSLSRIHFEAARCSGPRARTRRARPRRSRTSRTRCKTSGPRTS